MRCGYEDGGQEGDKPLNLLYPTEHFKCYHVTQGDTYSMQGRHRALLNSLYPGSMRADAKRLPQWKEYGEIRVMKSPVEILH